MKPYYGPQSGVTIYHGDCLEVMHEWEGQSFDLLLTDPPYGVAFRGHEWDREIPDWLPLGRQVAKTVIFTTGTLTLWDYPRPDWVLCWARPASNSRSCLDGFSHWSPVLVYGRPKFPVDFLSLHALAHASKFYDHPTPKPEPLMCWLVSYATATPARVLDPFMGTGTTLVAAKRLGRAAVGIEIEERYCEIAAKRLAQEVLPLEHVAEGSGRARREP